MAWAEFWSNSSFNASIEMSHFKAMYGREAPTIIKYSVEGKVVQVVDQLLGERDGILEELKTHLCRAQNAMKVHADQKEWKCNLRWEKGLNLKPPGYVGQSCGSILIICLHCLSIFFIDNNNL